MGSLNEIFMSSRIKILGLYKRLLNISKLYIADSPDFANKLPENIRVAFKMNKNLINISDIEKQYNNGLDIYNILLQLHNTKENIPFDLLMRKNTKK